MKSIEELKDGKGVVKTIKELEEISRSDNA